MIERSTFVWALGVVCQLNRIPFDAELVLRQFPPPYDTANLQRALQSYGLNTSLKNRKLNRLAEASLPCLAFIKTSQPQNNTSTNTTSFTNNQVLVEGASNSLDTDLAKLSRPLNTQHIALVLKRDADRLLIVEPGQTSPVEVSIEEFSTSYIGQVLMVRQQDEAVTDIDNSAGSASQPFGFRWFIPELLKYKRIWSEILLASLTIQLVGLTVPVCTQIVIDKVVVHHTISTLEVIAVALFMFLVFNAAMGWVRQYLVLHTGNRIDATLGHKVFSHLLDLPLRYYEHRPTGVVVARIHGVETIREFLAGSLVTLLLDFPFLIVFLAIMFWYSWQLTLIALTGLILISLMSVIVTPIFRKKLNHQFMLGARNQAFMTEYISGMETVKSLQMEPQLKQRFGDYLSSYLNATF